MAAAVTDKFKKAGASTVTSLAAPGKAIGATSITVGSTTNYPLDTGVVVAIRVVDTAGKLIPGTYTEWNAIVTSATSFTLDPTPVYGSDQVYAAGSSTQVYISVSSSAHNQLVDGLLVSHDQDGTLKAGAVDVAAVLANDVVETAKIKDAAVTTAKIIDASVTAAKIDFTNLGSAMVEKTTGAFTTTSGSFVDITGASVSFTKQQNTTRILVSMTVVSSVSVTGVGSHFAVNINSTDYRVVSLERTTTTTLSAGGSRVITGIPSGTYTVNGRALVGGGATLDIGAGKYVLITVAEF